ncbi:MULTISPECIES: hypothetical protein [Pseudomonas]|uniref:Uncharacterized protein n=1 Tax=Pseudomonas lutea TaxID=243924 RepID=A0A9X8MH79_9PSED|nr:MULTISPECIES: hypothetical protein [Pseudomonas]SER38149.1 hypothetical protein SAMN05216409_118127 [Pseudomonas lutea]
MPIQFTPFRTPRLTVELRELPIGDAIDLVAKSPIYHEANTTALLKVICKPSDRQAAGQVDDPRLWTVQERGAVIAHYLVHQSGTGDFPIGDGGARFSQYMKFDVQTAEPVTVGPVADDVWTLYPLLGFMAESIERLVVTGRIKGGRVGWIIACLAAQMRRSDDIEFAGINHTPDLGMTFCERLENLSDAVLDDWLFDRVQIMRQFPDSDFADMLDSYLAATAQAQHLLNMGFNEEGIVYISEVAGTPPARFPLPDLLSERTARFLALFDEPARGADKAP